MAKQETKAGIREADRSAHASSLSRGVAAFKSAEMEAPDTTDIIITWFQVTHDEASRPSNPLQSTAIIGISILKLLDKNSPMTEGCPNKRPKSQRWRQNRTPVASFSEQGGV